jgi:hypothetical protein
MVRLDGTTLAKEGIWTVPESERPGDPDFASSPTLFHANVAGSDQPLVAACNKNGVLYGWKRDDLGSGPVWRLKVGLGTPQGVKSCLAAPIWNGSQLFEASNPTTIQDVPYLGSVRAVDPSTGVATWETGLGGIVLGSPSMSAGGVIAAPMYSSTTGATKGLTLVDSGNGRIVNFLPSVSGFAQPVFVDDGLLVATDAGRLGYWKPRTTGDLTPPSAPAVTATRSSDGTSATLAWPAANTSEAVASYRIFRNGAFINTVGSTATSFTDPGLANVTNYSYFVQAVDTSGNASVQSQLVIVPKPSGVPLFADGFEAGNLNLWQGGRNMVVQQTVVNSGNWAAKDVDKATAVATIPAAQNDIYVRLWFQVTNQGASPLDLLTLQDEAAKKVAKARLASDGRLQLQALTPTVRTRTSSVTPTKNAWHSLEVHVTVGAQGNIEAWLDGQPVPGVSGTWDFGSNPVSQILIGDTVAGRTLTSYFDDVQAGTQYIGP